MRLSDRVEALLRVEPVRILRYNLAKFSQKGFWIMNKLFAVLATSTLIIPAVASAGALEDAQRRGICGEDVTPLAAEYVDVEGEKTLKVLCPAAHGACCGGPLGAGTLTPASAAALGLGALGLGLILSDDESGTTTTTTTGN